MQGRRKSFEELAIKGKFRDKVEERKDRLVDRLTCAEDKDTKLIQIYGWKYSTYRLIEYLKEHEDEYTVGALKLKYVSSNPISVVFSTKGDAERSYDYLCVEYYHLYRCNKDHSELRRYTYFEVYYEDFLISCLMSLPAFQKNETFDALEMSRAEWAALKQQLSFWTSVITPEIEELEDGAEQLPEVVDKRIKRYRDEVETDECSETIAGELGSTMDLLWPVQTYLELMQLLPLLPPEMIPKYALNYVCDVNIQGELCSRLSALLKQYTAAEEPLDVLSGYMTDGNEAGAAYPYIFTVQTPQATKQLLKDIASFSTSEDDDWEKHPFARIVPICVSTKETVDSTMWDIQVTTEMLKEMPADELSRQAFWAGIAQWIKKGNGRLKRSKLWRRHCKLSAQILKENSTTFKPEPLQKELSLAASFLLFSEDKETPAKEIVKTNDWLNRQISAWCTRDDLKRDIITKVTDIITEQMKTAMESTPENEEELIEKYSSVFLKEDLFCITVKQFKQLTRELAPQGRQMEIREELIKKQLVKVNGDAKDYGIKLGNKKSVKVIAFFKNKLKKE